MIEIVRHTQRNVKRWTSGEMALRWTAAGMLEAEQQFRKIIGYRDLGKLVVAIEHDLTTRRALHTNQEAATLIRLTITPGTAAAKFHGERDILRRRA